MSRQLCVPPSEIDNRIHAVQNRLKKNEVEALLIIQRADLFYFTGTAQDGVLFIPAQGDPLLSIKRYFPRARKESPISTLIEITSVTEIPSRIRDVYGRMPKTLAFELDVIPARDFHFYQTLFPDTMCVDGSLIILETRMIKSKWEIEQMVRTAYLSAETFQYMKKRIAPGLTEMEFAGMFEAFAKKHGHSGKLKTSGLPGRGVSLACAQRRQRRDGGTTGFAGQRRGHVSCVPSRRREQAARHKRTHHDRPRPHVEWVSHR
ncbi:MAG: aminopeptidase P family N-terminal domain-containing protein [Deltaproteobacteria bacterium]|nr:aminopeptidase P family N-terminal domain-containing protein [Deltaproteobacteria bacterium]